MKIPFIWNIIAAIIKGEYIKEMRKLHSRVGALSKWVCGYIAISLKNIIVTRSMWITLKWVKWLVTSQYHYKLLLSLRVCDLHCLNVMLMTIYYRMNKLKLNQLTCNNCHGNPAYMADIVTVSTKQRQGIQIATLWQIHVSYALTCNLWVRWLLWNISKEINMLDVKFYHCLQKLHHRNVDIPWHLVHNTILPHHLWITISYDIIMKTYTQNTSMNEPQYNETALWKTLLENLNVRIVTGISIRNIRSCSTS